MTQTGLNSIGRGYVQVYTGNCKGKTTAALGLAFRAMGWGMRTYIGQFMKGQSCGELHAASLVGPYITIEQLGQDSFVQVGVVSEANARMAKEGLSRVKRAMQSGEYSIVVLDEINTANYFQLISTDEVLEIIAQKPEGVELVLTGRYAHPEVIAAADLVTEMAEVKHYCEKGVWAREGIEL